jgi:hypothetical protein
MYRPLYILPNGTGVDPYIVTSVIPFMEGHNGTSKSRVNIYFTNGVAVIYCENDQAAKNLASEIITGLNSYRAKEGLYLKYKDALSKYENTFLGSDFAVTGEFKDDKDRKGFYEGLSKAHEIAMTPNYDPSR